MTDATINDDMQIKGVYHSLESIFNVLKKEENKSLPEVQELLVVFNNNYKKKNKDVFTSEQKRKPLIVLEGLDASGKTTIGRNLAKMLNGVKKSTPPECLLSLREKFDSHPVVLRRAYYGLGNYIADCEVEGLCKEKPVVMDRFWHSTTAYAIAHEVSNGAGEVSLPPAEDRIYVWPHDLTQPDVVLFLNVDEAVRNRRHERRNTSNTVEEKRLSENQSFRSILLETYKRMNNPSIVEIDSNQSIEEAVEEILRTIKPLIS